MKFLTEIDFTIDEIARLEETIADEIYLKIKNFPALIIENLRFLKKLGVRNYKELFSKFTHAFVKDYDSFKKTYMKYDTQDLVEKLAKNPGIVEYL